MGSDNIGKISGIATIVLAVMAMVGGLWQISATLTQIEEALARNTELIKENREYIGEATSDRWTAKDQQIFVANLKLLNPTLVLPAATAYPRGVQPLQPIDEN